MPIDRAELEKRAEDLKYKYEELRNDPERFRRVIMIVIASVAVTLTVVIWAVRLIPSAPEAEPTVLSQQHTSVASWQEDALRKLGRDRRYQRVGITQTDSGIIVFGRVATRDELNELRRIINRSGPPAAVRWDVGYDEAPED